MPGNVRGGSRGGRVRLAFGAALALALVVVAAASPASFKQAAGSPLLLAPNTSPGEIHIGDVNGDGRPDIVVLDYDASGNADLAVYFGAGGGKYTKGPVSQVGSGADGAYYFQLADLNGDHHLDAVVTENNDEAIAVYLGDGKGHFTKHGSNIGMQSGSQPDEVTIGDVNGDGKPDLILPSSYVAGFDSMQGDGTGNFSEFPNMPYLYANQISLGDYLDGPTSALVADFDGDRVPDVLMLNLYHAGSDSQSYGSLMLFKGNGAGAFSLETTVSLPGVPAWFAEGDFNHDGIPDVVVSFTTLNEVIVYLGNGDGSFTAQAPVSTPAPDEVVVGDFNGDGLPDVATTAGTLSGGLDILLGNGHGGLAEDPGVNPSTTPALEWMTAADVNADHKTDILGYVASPAEVQVLLSQGGPAASGTVAASTLTGEVGATITINGTNLDTVAFVSFGGPDGAIQTQSATKITVNVPDGALAGKLTLIGANGATSTSNVFTPIEAPQITSLSPLPGTKVGGTETINGLHFTGTSSVTFGGIPATSFKVVSDSKITAVVPANAGTPLEVTNTVNFADTPFTLIVGPSIDSFSPTDGPANPTQTTDVHISGHNLQGVTSVTFGGVPAPAASISISVDGESLEVTTPPTAKTGPIVVKNVAGSYSTIVNDDPNKTFTVDPQPTITKLSAVFGNTGDTITITGTNLIGITAVNFAGNVAGTSLDTSGAPTSISVKVPADAGLGKVTAVGPYGTATSPSVFTPHIAPIVSAFSPSIGALPGATISITGFHFTGTKSVTFAANGGTVPAKFKAVSDGTIQATIPATAITGVVDVTNAYGDGGESYYVVQTPVLAATGAFAPSAGGAGQQVVITGQHLGGTTSVTFGGLSAAWTTDSDTQITAHAPPGFTQGVVAVTNAAGTATTTNKFTEVAISDFSPQTTDGTAGTFTVDGSGLTAVTKIVFAGTFGSQVAENQGGTDSAITFPIQPCGSTGKFQLIVPGADPVQSASSLTYTGPACT